MYWYKFIFKTLITCKFIAVITFLILFDNRFCTELTAFNYLRIFNIPYKNKLFKKTIIEFHRNHLNLAYIFNFRLL